MNSSVATETQDDAVVLRPITWNRVTEDRLDYAEKFLDVMGEMDRHYQDNEEGAAYPRMAIDGCHYFYGTGAGFEVVVGFQWNQAREKFQLRTAGFRGDISPYEALLQMIELARPFVRKINVSSVYTIVPLKMDNPRIVQMYGLIPWCRRLRVTGGHHVEGGTYWKLELAEEK